MDPTKPSLSSKAPHANSGGGNEPVMEEAAAAAPGPWREAVDGDRQRDMEADAPDGTPTTAAAAEISPDHRGSVADKQTKYSTLGYQRRTKQKVVTDFATLSKGASAGAKSRAALRQVLFSQGVSDKSPASEEGGQLDALKQNLEAYPVPVSLRWRWKDESNGTTLEKSWTEIVHSHSTMSRMQKHQQEALWEFVHTELTYINKLFIIKDLVVAALDNLRQHGFLQEVTPELLFSNLPFILVSHQLFWQEVIYPMLQEVRTTGKPFDPMRLEAGCLQFHERLSSYQHYCWEEEDNLEFTRRQMESNPHFLTYVQWVETHPQCARMRLGDMQAIPHQRITKYPLLLKAVLKTTQDPQVQQTLRGMLSSVNSFLESINDYLRLKDEELALTISAQRVEGYEVEGINEDVDKHVREICQFDLTCPVRGVGPTVVRKLLLEENLKIRGRRDSKVEVVALLFSDVLLITKAQKKGERLKVIRPPLALDRTYCITLKDGSSFVLIEVGELQSAMNVYIFAASTSESCSTWVYTINQAKETLRNLRETESNRQQQNLKIQQLEAKPVTEANINDMETDEQTILKSRKQSFVDELTEKLITPKSINGMVATKNKEERHQPPGDVAPRNTARSFARLQPINNNHKSATKGFAGRQKAVPRHEWIEMGVRGGMFIHHKEEGKIIETVMTQEQQRTWNGRVQSEPNLHQVIYSGRVDPLRSNIPRPYHLLLDGYPDVDYPTNEESASQPFYQQTISREAPVILRPPGEGGISTRRDLNLRATNRDSGANSTHGQSEDVDTPSESRGFPKNLRSPGLRRKRQVSNHQGASAHPSGQFIQGFRPDSSASDSYSDSEYSRMNVKRNSVPVIQSPHRVLKLGSLRPNQGMFWNIHDRASPDPQTMSESELPDPNSYNKRPKVRTQRSASIPNIVIHNNVYASPRAESSYPEEHNANSPLEGLLERAKERVRDNDDVKRDRTLKTVNLRARYPPPSPSFSSTPSSAASDGDRDTEWEEEVELELMRHRALTVSKGWREQLVDGDEDGRRHSVIFADGVNVDWSGWCFDDDEVMDHLQPGSESLLEGISRSLGHLDVHRLSEQEDGECSHV